MGKKFVWNRNLRIRLAAETVFNIFYWMYFPFIAIYFSGTLGLGWTGILMTLPPIISLIAGLAGGAFADKYGRRKVMLWGTGIQIIMFMLFAGSQFIWLDYAAFLGITIGKGLYKPASDAMVADTVPHEERKAVFATFLTGGNIGAVVGPVVGAWLFFDYREELLSCCAIVLIVYFILIFRRFKETLPTASAKEAASIKQEFMSYTAILNDKKFAYYLGAGIFSVIAIMQLDLYLAIYIYEAVPSQKLFAFLNYELSSEQILGYLLGVNGILFVLFILPVTKWLKSWQDMHVFILSCLLSGFGMFAVVFTANIWLLFVLTIIFTFGEIVRAPVLYNFVSEYAPQHARGQYMAASNMQFTIGRFLAPCTILLAQFFEPFIVFSFILLCALASLILYIKLYNMPRSAN
ncbi:MDR family MFS transporter [Solibacillus silvestris]|uniref:MDR family MFS transporter n=1 Tax=Solibacillus silvestris TaxID=76853 RepID=UPI003F807201